MEISYPLLHKLRNASRLSPQEWLFFIEAWFWMLVFDIGLRTLPFPKLQAYAARITHQPEYSAEQNNRLICVLKDAINHASYNHIYPMTCLRKSLALQRMLAQRGIASELKIGVRKKAGQFNAHAWLEHQGKHLGKPEWITKQYFILKTCSKR